MKDVKVTVVEVVGILAEHLSEGLRDFFVGQLAEDAAPGNVCSGFFGFVLTTAIKLLASLDSSHDVCVLCPMYSTMLTAWLL